MTLCTQSVLFIICIHFVTPTDSIALSHIDLRSNLGSGLDIIMRLVFPIVYLGFNIAFFVFYTNAADRSLPDNIRPLY